MSDNLAAVDLSPAHAGAGFRLSKLIGWNQAPGDWDYVLAHGDGVGLETPDGELAATAMALPYDRFAWICLVLVAPDYRRRGLATRLMDQVVARQEAAGRIPGLDATPDGREVYRRIGFVDLYRLARYRADAISVRPQGQNTDIDIRLLTESDFELIAPMDEVLFGANRLPLLHHLRRRQPAAALGAWRGNTLAGYVFARDGREATQLGPLRAADDGVAIALAANALEALSPPFYVDVPDLRAEFAQWLGSAGFALQRPFIRMYRGRDTGYDDPTALYAIAGPELG